MKRIHLYDALTFASFASAAVLFAVGCENLQQAYDAAGTINPATGNTPFEDITSGVGQVIISPTNIPAWIEIVGGLAVLVGAFFGTKKVVAVRAARKTAAADLLASIEEDNLSEPNP
jgi:phosphate/sulfate permease